MSGDAGESRAARRVAASTCDRDALGGFLARDDIALLTPEDRVALLEEWSSLRASEEGLDDRILLGIVGGTGVGKSTFINALAGERISRSGDRRPTTDRIIVYRHADADLPDGLPVEHLSRPQVLHQSDALRHVSLLDFPDFDSAERLHRDILELYVDHVDLLFVVVDDVKYGDRRLYDLLADIHQDAGNIWVLLNKVDGLVLRYQGDWPRVARTILDDLRAKLAEHASLAIAPERLIPFSALAILEERAEGATERERGEFERIEGALGEFRVEKRRRAAKALNLEARWCDVEDACARAAFGAEGRAALEDGGRVLEDLRGAADRALASIPREILTERERRRRRRARFRVAGAGWGAPFSLVFTLGTEFRRGRSSSDGADGDPAARIERHYRVFLESLANLRARFRSELAGTRYESLGDADGDTSGAGAVRLDDIASDFSAEVEAPGAPPSRRARWLAHVPAVLVLSLALWRLLYPALSAAFGEGDESVLGALFEGLLGALSPLFLGGLIGAVLFTYAATAGVLWLREVQAFDVRVDRAEERVRERVLERGRQFVESLGEKLAALRRESAELERILGRSATDVSEPGASPRAR